MRRILDPKYVVENLTNPTESNEYLTLEQGKGLIMIYNVDRQNFFTFNKTQYNIKYAY